MNQKSLIVIVGPTAVGKTALSIDVAQKLNTEIISADSRQFFKEMSIGTAKPLPNELQQVQHHFINSHSVSDDYNAGKFGEEALTFVNNFFKKKDLLLLTGGSGLYIDAVCNGMDELPKADEKIREQLSDNLKQNGIIALQQLLKEHDPVHYEKADLLNPHRLIRAIEVCIVTGKPYSDFRKGDRKQHDFQIVKVGLTIERKELYEKINQRVDDMIQQGLLEEVRSLLRYKNQKALQTVGYKELFDYLEGKTDLETAVALIKQNTRRYAKRQLTWFGKDKEIKWFHPKELQEIMNYITSFIENAPLNKGLPES